MTQLNNVSAAAVSKKELLRGSTVAALVAGSAQAER